MALIPPVAVRQHIKRIKIQNLFGHLSYDLAGNSDGPEYDDLLILYGDNGSGKTTILQLLFHLLSTEEGRGHKTFLAKTPFSKFEVFFGPGSYVGVEKSAGKLTGGFTIRVRQSDKIHPFVVRADDNGTIKSTGNPFPEMHRALATLGVSLYFLPDDRRVQADFSDELSTSALMLRNYQQRRGIQHRQYGSRIAIGPHGDVIAMSGDESDTLEPHRLEISPVLDALTSTLSRQTILGSNAGEENASSIYLRVIAQLNDFNRVRGTGAATSEYDFIQRLSEVHGRIQRFSTFGLLPSFPAESFTQVFADASEPVQRTIREILAPYLEGLEARLFALQETYDLISTYVETLNSFFSRKTIDLNIQTGITVTSQWGERIDPNYLSSGERQLLLLLSNTILARKRSTIFIIDEPELSLNVKWQRKLVDALLRCSHNGGIQYILASHSLELITQYQSRTVRLSPVED